MGGIALKRNLLVSTLLSSSPPASVEPPLPVFMVLLPTAHVSHSHILSSKGFNTLQLQKWLPLLSLGGYIGGLLLVGSVSLNSETSEDKILEYNGLFLHQSVVWNIHKCLVKLVEREL